ncbi:monovalent cation/H(+) antiporter subunit G [Thioalkalivibrio sp. HK1]|uniref:monovalent cation/H(+) antiporter subunit G n=1 Tax=Thioalkalivibrio sp. HK1 TaxID=1469245 RepID=UPI000471BED5|nr:monovalent cation/H(+) antiporter subunit G [Thioalkalivibrio sp. HK1]
MTLAIDLLASLCLLTGTIFLIIGAIGLVRLPDFFTRIHATGVIDTLGTGLVLIGLMLIVGWTQPLIWIKLVLIMAFMLITGPTATHSLARTALHGRLDPLSSRPSPEKPPSST